MPHLKAYLDDDDDDYYYYYVDDIFYSMKSICEAVCSLLLWSLGYDKTDEELIKGLVMMVRKPPSYFLGDVEEIHGYPTKGSNRRVLTRNN